MKTLSYEQLLDRAENRFWANTIITEEGCWIWIGNKTPNGYGAFAVGTQHMNAHAFSWMLHNGVRYDQIPMDPVRPTMKMSVLHSCDRRDCVNPDHLSLGTHQENMDDMKAKGRSHAPKPGLKAHYARLRQMKQEAI